MEIGIESLLDVALGGPEIGPLNMSVLHGLLREVFQKLNLSNETLLISENHSDFSESFNFIKSKFDANKNRPRTPRGSFKLGRSKVSVIVTDYFRNPLGNTNPSEINNNITLSASADVEDRIRYLESQLKGLKAFPSVNELREWARDKKNPDTIVTDLWHFVSLNHRMDGVEEGMGKLSELVDKLIPELKMNFEDLRKIKGQIDDLYNQCSTLTDCVSQIDERIDNGVVKAEEKLQEIYNNENELHKMLNSYAKISDLESYTPTHVFNDAQEKALALFGEIKEDISSNVSAELHNKVDKGEVEMLSNWVKILRAQMETVPSKDDLLHMDLYVKWPQLEDALTTSYSSRPCSRQGCCKSINRMTGYEKNSDTGNEQVCPEILTMCHKKKFPTASCLQRLQDLGSVVEKQASLMDALQSTRVELQDKASKSDLEKYVLQEDLQHLLSMLTNLRQEVNSIQNWRESVDEEKIPAIRELMAVLEKQASDLLATLEHLNCDRNQKDKQIDNLFTFVERLEQCKLDKNDSCLEQFARKTSIQPAVEGFMAERLPQLNSQSGIFNQNISPCGNKKYTLSHDNEVELLNKSLSISSVSPNDFINTKLTDHNKDLLFNNSYNDKFYKENEENYKDKESLSDLDDEIEELNLCKESDYTDAKPESCNVEKKLFDQTISKLESLLKTIAVKLKNHKKTCEKNLSRVFDNLDNKLDRWELQPLQDYLEERCNSLSQQQEEFQNEIPNSSKLQKKSSWLEGSQNNSSNIHKRTGKSFKDKAPSKNQSPNIVCTHPHYGNGFLPQEKEAAAVRKQMNFNCLSCDRPLILQTNNHLQTIRGRPFNAYELDQLKLLQKVLRGDSSKQNRSCGGEYTLNTPMQKLNVRINTGMSLPSVPKETNQSFIDNEIDIEGVDGRLYRGLLSRRDLSKQHSRSKSETAELRTVSPRISSG
ncbi:uncharacterized protein LOC100206884 isoform X1 [Hydra vulgaris]|uniref:uncharacterized protein LOC100206884 isoform X1 n=1 Tax=Hydra vulgaris TaxID=6087 RepID=UPI001F5F416C|nr:uncharacterized protein LOC100206884 [Hydra vulgaris]